MKIEVTKEEIEKGIRNDAYKDPIALAVTRTVGREASVYPNWRTPCMVYFDINNHTLKLPLPQFVNRLALAYDAGSEMEPFEFELNTE